MSEPATISVYARTRRASIDPDVDREPFQAEIMIGEDEPAEYHFATGTSPAQALHRAAGLWLTHELCGATKK